MFESMPCPEALAISSSVLFWFLKRPKKSAICSSVNCPASTFRLMEVTVHLEICLTIRVNSFFRASYNTVLNMTRGLGMNTTLPMRPRFKASRGRGGANSFSDALRAGATDARRHPFEQEKFRHTSGRRSYMPHVLSSFK